MRYLELAKAKEALNVYSDAYEEKKQKDLKK